MPSAETGESPQPDVAAHLETARESGPPYYDEESKARAVDAMKPLIISTRRAERRCVMCGKPLGEQTGPLADKHADCPSFQPGSDQNIVDTGYEAYRRNGYWKCRNCSRYIIPGSGVTRVWNSYDGQWERAHMDRYCPKCGAATMYRLR